MDSLSTALYDYLENKFQKEEFSGSVLVTKNNEKIFSAGVGLANREHLIKCTPETKFRIGSITKQFTSMAIMMLLEQRFLNERDKLIKFFPNYIFGESVTIHHLLTHTSGIPNITQLQDFNKLMTEFTPLNLTTELIMKLPLDFQPGSQFRYSNSGYLLLAQLIQVVTGQTYAEFLTKNIFCPLLMNSTGSDNYREIISQRASGYEMDNTRGFVNSAFIDMSIATGGGDLLSTTEDLYKWDRSLYFNKLVTSDGMQRLFTDYGFGYGYGWFIKDELINKRPSKSVFHGGGIVGFKNKITRYLDDQVSIIVLNNLSTTDVDDISNNITNLIYQKS
ncbi:serine hydrolase domain-containing protein [Paenibacillus sp. MER 99-2]|uniref:serine hydrolase domain-containing protein n=1 Tax=Paenibacillus sp. MER 99-2 TaxID=2939572 RepID=UPI00203C56C6|nr:serine hydrolase domain-containing protein [Paenibacillus sp. MER 99-2]MCM3172887.1 beta-lactamase family protein [Paenibacillus sp. MER 99-2]